MEARNSNLETTIIMAKYVPGDEDSLHRMINDIDMQLAELHHATFKVRSANEKILQTLIKRIKPLAKLVNSRHKNKLYASEDEKNNLLNELADIKFENNCDPKFTHELILVRCLIEDMIDIFNQRCDQYKHQTFLKNSLDPINDVLNHEKHRHYFIRGIGTTLKNILLNQAAQEFCLKYQIHVSENSKNRLRALDPQYYIRGVMQAPSSFERLGQ